MVRNAAMRASDVDREAAVALLREHHAVGRLTLEEFRERMETACKAVTLGDLARLLYDLPPPEHLERDVEVILARAASWRASGAAASGVRPPGSGPPPARPASDGARAYGGHPVPGHPADSAHTRAAGTGGSAGVLGHRWAAAVPWAFAGDGPARREAARRAVRVAWTVLNAVTACNVVLWLLVALTGGGIVHFWPIWVWGPGAAVLGVVEFVLWRHDDSPG